jgi:putative ABC transport system permease protein
VFRCHVYLRLPSGADAEQIRAGLPAFLDRHSPPPPTGRVSDTRRLALVPISEIHLRPPGRFAMKLGGDPRVLSALSLVGLLILLTAASNYINLMTARASQRAVEVGVRKAAGGSRADLALQFIGESLIYSFLGVLLAIMLVELLLPQLNSFLDRNITFDYWSAPLLAALFGLALMVGTLAGLYPALVLAAFRPAVVLKGGGTRAPGSGRLRQVFVLLQFTILIGLMLATGVIQQQTAFGLRAGLRFDRDQLLWILVPQTACQRSAFTAAVQALPGVRGTACSMEFLVNYGTQQYRASDGREVTLQNTFVGPGLFELLGLKPVAGRFFAQDREADVLPDSPRERDLAKTYRTVINETAARELGYTDAAAAIGRCSRRSRTCAPARGARSSAWCRTSRATRCAWRSIRSSTTMPAAPSTRSTSSCGERMCRRPCRPSIACGSRQA